MKRNTIIAAAGVATGALVGAELYLRHRDHLYNRDQWFHKEYDGSHPYKVFHNRSGWELMPGYDVAGIRINQYGFRGEDFSKRKPSGTQRIICLGDSCTFGAPGDETPYPYQLQHCLNAMELQNSYQTVNAGVEGHESIHALLRLPWLLTFKPDILVVYLGWSDLWNSDPSQYPDLRRKTNSFWHYGNGAYSRSMVLTSLKQTLGLIAPPPAVHSYELDNFIPVNFEYNMSQIIRTSKRDGVRVVLTTLPAIFSLDDAQPSLGALEKIHYPVWLSHGDLDSLKQLYQIFDHAIRHLAVTEDVDLIDLNAPFNDGHGDRDRYFFDTCHPMPEGNLLIARALAEGLPDREIIE